MKNKKLLCSVCFLFTFMSVLWGQNITVKGNVTSKTDGQPIIGASVVQNDSKSTGTITDLDGNFTLPQKASGWRGRDVYIEKTFTSVCHLCSKLRKL